MPTTPEARQRLAALIEKRREELGMLWQDVADAGDVSLKTLYNVRTQEDGEISPPTRRKLEAALRWEPGSIERILAGGEPQVASSRGPERPRPHLAEVPNLDDDAAMELLIERSGDDRELLEVIWRAYKLGKQPRDVVIRKMVALMTVDASVPPASGRDNGGEARNA